jgi:hypothetical protein
MRKLRLQEGRWLGHGHQTDNQESQHPHSGLPGLSCVSLVVLQHGQDKEVPGFGNWEPPTACGSGAKVALRN